MATRYDVLDARDAFNEHCGTHHCRLGECEIRVTLWRRYQGIAAKWGLAPDDDIRQRQQFFERNPSAIRQPSYNKAA